MNSLTQSIIIFLLSISIATTKAAEGCLVGNNIYLTRTNSAIQVDLIANGMNVFKSDTPFATNNCISGTIQGTCQVCHGNPSVGLNVLGLKVLVCTLGLDLFRRVDNGVYYSSYVLECDLDDYSMPLTAAVGALGLIIIRRRNKT